MSIDAVTEGAVSAAPDYKKVAIVCGAPASEYLAPFDDEEWGIWVLGNRFDRHADKRVTRIFEIHDDLSDQDPRYPEWIVDQNIPMVVGEGFPVKAGHVQVFPFDDSRELFGSTYLTSSPAYMMCMAILEGATHIGVYGVDMSVDDNEYFWQRPCMEAWIGFAKGKGIDVRVHETSPVLNCDFVEGRGSGGKPDFSMPPWTQAAFLEMAKKHSDKIEEIHDKIHNMKMEINAHSGAQQAYERLSNVARAIEAGQKIDSLVNTTVVP